MAKRLTKLTIRECNGMTCADATGEDSVLKGVKVLGSSSLNRRQYTPEAVVRALPLYENARVNLDHPGRPTDSRSLRDRFGKLVNCRSEGGEMYADLRFNPAHQMAEAVKWWAQNDPDCLGLSHNAVGEGESRDGVFIVQKIVSVRSVDLVADPATVKSLFESKSRNQGVTIKLKAFLEGIESRLDVSKRARLKKLLEDDYGADVAMEAPDDVDSATDPAEALWSGFRSAIMAMIDGDGSADEKANAIKDYLRTHEKLSSGKGGKKAETEEEDEEEEPPVKKKDDDDADMESVRRKALADPALKPLLERLDRLDTESKLAAKRAKANALIETARLPKEAISDLFLDTLLEAKDEKTMKALVEDRKRLSRTTRPVSAAGHQTNNTLSAEDFKRQLKKGVR